MSEHLVDARRRSRAFDATASAAALRGRWPASAARPPRAQRARRSTRIDRRGGAARPGRGLPPAQARPRADGLLRPDRARRPAGRASSPRSAQAERAKFQVVLLDEYQDTSVAQALMLQPAVLRPDAGHGRGHPVTAVGDPNQAIYGWRGASVSNILDFGRRRSRGRRRDRRRDVPAHGQPPLRRADPRGRQPARRAALRRLARAAPARAEARTPAAARSRVAVHETYADELAWLRRPGHGGPRRRSTSRPGARSAC